MVACPLGVATLLAAAAAPAVAIRPAAPPVSESCHKRRSWRTAPPRPPLADKANAPGKAGGLMWYMSTSARCPICSSCPGAPFTACVCVSPNGTGGTGGAR